MGQYVRFLCFNNGSRDLDSSHFRRIENVSSITSELSVRGGNISSVVPHRISRPIIQVHMANSRGTRTVFCDFPDLDKVCCRVCNRKIVFVERGRHYSVRTATGARSRELESRAGDGTCIRVQVPGGHVAWSSGETTGRSVEVLGRCGVFARNDDLICEIVCGVCKTWVCGSSGQ